jgi:ribulose-phosphate 3-epimerase
VPVVAAIKPLTAIPLDCHLMIDNPERYVESFVKAGADMISVHAENQNHLHRTLQLIREFGVKPGVALNPVTPLDYAFEVAEFCDFILLMSVNPGFGGQKFIHSFLRRCGQLKTFLDNNSFDNVEIQVDGGVKIDNVEEIVRAGANILVCGSGLFHGDFQQNMAELRKNAEKGRTITV